MSVVLKCQWLSHFGPHRAKALLDEGVISHVRAPLWPLDAAAQDNMREWWKFHALGIPLYGWLNASADQAGDVDNLHRLDDDFQPAGWVLDIEGEWTKGANLSVLCAGAKALGKPVVASLAGSDASHVEYDYRSLDRIGALVEWQAYHDSGEGPTPHVAVEELYRSSFVIEDWQYRARYGKTYGWGKVRSVEPGFRAVYDYYPRPGVKDAHFAVVKREWGWTVHDRVLYREGVAVGQILGRARYAKIGVALIVTQEIEPVRSLEEWTAYAASAHGRGLPRRPVAVYPAERASDDVLRAIAKGAP